MLGIVSSAVSLEGRGSSAVYSPHAEVSDQPMRGVNVLSDLVGLSFNAIPLDDTVICKPPICLTGCTLH